MRKMGFVSALVAALAVMSVAPAAFAQNHGEVGIFGEYFRNSSTDTNFGGVGGRLAVNAAKHVQVEAEMSYDFERLFTEGLTNPSSGAVSFQQTPVRILHGLFGFKVQNAGPVRIFATAKGGFINFRFDPSPVGFSAFTSSVTNLRANDVSGVFYPGVGAEAYLGPIGLRLDVGDEMYFRNGTHNNVRIAFGPHIRF